MADCKFTRFSVKAGFQLTAWTSHQMSHDLFDMTALARSRNRARNCSKPAMFLHERAVQQITERLEEVNRTFKNVAIVTAFPDVWRDLFPSASFVDEADVLKFTATDHDLIIHAMSLHWSNDPLGQMIQCNRALQPDGLFLAILFGSRTLQELRSAMAEAEIEIYGGVSPRVAPMAEIRDLGGLLQRAGFALLVADSDLVKVTYSQPKMLLQDLRAMGEVNVMIERSRAGLSREFYNLLISTYRVNFTNRIKNIFASFELIFLTGWAPSPVQQQPLKPGSATTRLADALGTTEHGEDV